MESRAARSAASWCWLLGTAVVVWWSLAGCRETESSSILRVEGSLHLDEHLDHAMIEGSELPASLPEPVVWDFSQPQPVSMLDLLPTVAVLLDLPIPETAQGCSLAPILLGGGDFEPAPVIQDEFFVDEESGELRGLIEVVDGWWGAALEIGDGAANEVGKVGAKTDEKRPSPLLLYDLRKDPFTLHSLHEEHPERVERFSRLL